MVAWTSSDGATRIGAGRSLVGHLPSERQVLEDARDRAALADWGGWPVREGRRFGVGGSCACWGWFSMTFDKLAEFCADSVGGRAGGVVVEWCGRGGGRVVHVDSLGVEGVEPGGDCWPGGCVDDPVVHVG